MTHAYQDASLPVDKRVEDLLGRLSLEEKAGQLTQYFYFGAMGDTSQDIDLNSVPEEYRIFAQQPLLVESALQNGGAGSALFVKDAATANRLQKMAIEGSRWGIPLLFGFDVIHGFRTVFPAPIAMAASWDPSLAEQAQAVAGTEARAVGINWTFAPMVDITSDPRWGRIFEGAGEDPVLGSAMAAAQVRGFQNGGGILAGPKHFAGYGAGRGGRDYDDADVSDTELHNIYFPPFKAAIDAGAKNVMSAYMDLNGVPASGNRWLLTEVLRDELGFDGFVVSDANAVRSLETQHFAKDLAHAAARAVDAGLDLEMCMFDPAYSRLPAAVEQGLVDEATIDEAVRRVLRAKFEAGVFEHPYVDEDAADCVLATTGHRDNAQESAERTFVLLKNEGVLPLREGISRIAVLGYLADSQRDILGPWVFAHDTSEAVSILDGLRRRAGQDVSVEFAPAVAVPERIFPSMFDRHEPALPCTPEGFDENAELERAVELASSSDVAIVVVGQPQNMIGENASSSTLDLPGRQLELLQRVHATGTTLVVLVMSGRPLDLRWADEHVDAILQIWYPGTRGGDAVARTLFGDVSPAGRLPFTWPRHVGHVPMVYSHYRTFAPDDQEKRYWDEPSSPLYPFGYGLSYGRFEYSDVQVPEKLAVGDEGEISVRVTNTSDVAADEVVQFYIHQRYGTSTRPVRELKHFKRIHLTPGESRQVKFRIGPDQLRYWSPVTRGWVQDSTMVDIFVGGDSRCDLSAEMEVV